MLQVLKRFTFLDPFYRADLRALALMRIAVGLVVISDLVIRAGDLTAHYTDAGLWPREILLNLGWKKGYWSVFLLDGSAAWSVTLFTVGFVLALLLVLGYRTRLVSALLWLFSISLHNRNLYIQQAGDDLLRLVLLWGILLPWQNAWSIDARQRRLATGTPLAQFGYFLLLASVYFFSAVLKSDKDWYSDGSAVYYALSLDQLRMPYAGDWLYRFPGLMKILTWLVLGIEFLIPLLILWPQRKGHLRGLALVLILFIHIGFGSTLYVGLFFVIGIATAIGLAPASWMNRLEQQLKLKPVATDVPPAAAVTTYGRAGLSLMIICGSLLVNLASLPWFNYQPNTPALVTINALRLDQYWGMFSPHVMRKDGWFVYYGIDSIGRQWDLRLNQDYVDFSKPAHVVSMYRSDRWRKLAENMQSHGVFLRPLYCGYVLRRWNREHPEKHISTLNLYYMSKENLPDYKSTAPVKNLYCVCIEH